MNAPARALCACGSGLSAARCCALDAATHAFSADDGEQIAIEAERAAAALQLGNKLEAEQACLNVLEKQPRRPLALATLAEIRFDERKTEAAVVLLKRLAELEPSNVWPLNKLALLELRRGNAGEAETYARHAVRLTPANAQAHNLMGMVMTQQRRPSLGVFHCRRALELSNSRIPLVLANLATNLTALGETDEARALYREADALDPDNAQTLRAWAQLEEADRNLDAANILIDRLAALLPDSTATTLMRAEILGRQKRWAEAVILLDDNAASRNRPLRPMERLERGRLLDRLGRYDEAWVDFVSAKAQARELTGHSYLEKDASELAQQLRGFFTRQHLAGLPHTSVRTDVAQPIFILGFPRSGTTLIEQTLTASPLISAGDELPFIHEIAAAAPRLLGSPFAYPGALAELFMGDGQGGLDMLRDHYLRRAAQAGFVSAEAGLFTDKMPLNEIHLGLIALLFPKAPLVHVVRHPLDIMVSCMANVFTHGGFCGTALESAAKHLMLSTGLVAHYRENMDLNYIQVRYEDVVARQDMTMRRVFDFVGASFDPAVLKFELNPRYARTASYAQVAEPLYERSRYRYRSYRKHLDPAVEILAPLIERLGYFVEPA